MHRYLEFLAQKIPFLITKVPNFDNIAVNNVNTVFKDVVGEILMGPKATPISCVQYGSG